VTKEGLPSVRVVVGAHVVEARDLMSLYQTFYQIIKKYKH